ncbi:uncharacterized protein LOC121868939 [Homarus americanus]|uniref:uncharacterized protein LOC121868939 n=1 Tax=Homarus americanus TaxID=6706 RepID=UPI001C452795|nr:uncharacterized protein LOC121868939 [Homarus americanus]
MRKSNNFCDASQQAYGAVSYLRITSGDGAHSTSFVCGRAKLAPLKQQTIPRLELCAAVLAAKADKQLRDELELQIDRSVFWTDSMVTLQYTRNTERRFHTFVANRIETIHENSYAEQWRHVSSTQNPADDASRGLHGTELNKDCRWIQGPPFLLLGENNCPKNPKTISNLADGDPEVKGDANVLATGTDQGESTLKGLSAWYSSWHRLLKGVAWLRRFIQWRFSYPKEERHQRDRLKNCELDEARLAVLRLIQREGFPHEMDALERGHSIRTGDVSRLEPYLAADGLIRRYIRPGLATQDASTL